jgi:hypothetical protein
MMKVSDPFAEMDHVPLKAPMPRADVGPDILPRDALLAKDLPYVLGGVGHGRLAARYSAMIPATGMPFSDSCVIACEVLDWPAAGSYGRNIILVEVFRRAPQE